MRRLIIIPLLMLAVTLTARDMVSEGRGGEPQNKTRAEKKKEKQQKDRQELEETVTNGNFIFRPTAYRWEPGGSTNFVQTEDYRMEFRDGVIVLSMPYLFGVTHPYRLHVMNLTLPYVSDYIVEKEGDYIIISFDSDLIASSSFKFRLRILTTTGGADLLLTPNIGVATSYQGNIDKLY